MSNVASGKRRRTTVVGDRTTPTFDVDESVAAAVFAHVTNTRDRLALGCVSRVWRQVATTDGCWGTCDLVLDGELGKKITDERFENLLRYCVDVKRLEIRDAPRSFGLSCLSFEEYFLEEGDFSYENCKLRLLDQPYWARKLASLETLKLMGCPGVPSCYVLALLQGIGIPDRPKDERLRFLRIGTGRFRMSRSDYEFGDHDGELDRFRACLRVDPRDNYYDFALLQDRQRNISFDLWQCEYCVKVFTTLDSAMCVSCHKTYCHWHTEGFGSEKHRCKDCQSFVCHACEDDVTQYFCKGCDDGICESCVLKGAQITCDGSDEKPGCGKRFTKQLCNECEEPGGAEFGSRSQCSVCKCVWCDACNNDVSGAWICFDDDEEKMVCVSCVDKRNLRWELESEAEESSYPSLGPKTGVVRRQGDFFKRVCSCWWPRM
jgi:hypothetical protein|tara:strand:- start:816 stop:2114 length:1299 start_codon:yes stop_codon:yes gene_type:complete